MSNIIKIKSALAVGLWIIFFSVKRVVDPIFTTEQALKQMEDTAASFYSPSIYQQLWSFAWLIPLFICLVIFKNEITNFYYKKRGGF